jgi:adenine phosphoribosyltransferase
VHVDAVRPGGRYLVVDDVMATGGTAAAVTEIVEKQGAKVAACAFLIELAFLNGRAKLGDHEIISLITF